MLLVPASSLVRRFIVRLFVPITCRDPAFRRNHLARRPSRIGGKRWSRLIRVGCRSCGWIVIRIVFRIVFRILRIRIIIIAAVAILVTIVFLFRPVLCPKIVHHPAELARD